MADENYWTYRSSSPTPNVTDLPSGTFSGTQEQWETLSPGMHREIARQARKIVLQTDTTKTN